MKAYSDRAQREAAYISSLFRAEALLPEGLALGRELRGGLVSSKDVSPYLGSDPRWLTRWAGKRRPLGHMRIIL